MAAKGCPCSRLVSSNQARLRIRSCNVVWLHPSSSTCTLWLVSASQRKKIKTDDHLSMCNCSGATELDKAVKFRISRSAWCTFSRGEQIRGYVPRENEHHGAQFRGWCTNSRANLCAGARLREGDRIRCYTGSFSFISQPPNLDLLSLSILSLENCLFLESKIKCYLSKTPSDAHPQSISKPLIPLDLWVFCVAFPNNDASFTFSRKTTTWRKLKCQADIFLFSSFFFAAEYINYIGLTTSFNSGKFVLWVNIVPKDNVPGKTKVTSTVIRRITPENGYSASALTPKRPLLYVANVEPYEVYSISFSVALVNRRDRLYRSGGAVSFLIRYVVLILSQPGFFVLQNEGGGGHIAPPPSKYPVTSLRI